MFPVYCVQDVPGLYLFPLSPGGRGKGEGDQTPRKSSLWRGLKPQNINDKTQTIAAES